MFRPGNLLITVDHQLKITDFGTAEKLDLSVIIDREFLMGKKMNFRVCFSSKLDLILMILFDEVKVNQAEI